MEMTWEQATNKPDMPMILEQAWVYLRNDQPKGLAVGVRADGDPAFEEALKYAFTGSKKEWDKSSADRREQILDDYMEQMENAFALPLEQKNGMSTVYRIILIVDMMWLVAAGRVRNDNFNGTHFVWALNKR
jgi:hypothetical protein